MDRVQLPTKIAIAKKALEAAEEELGQLVGEPAEIPTNETVEVAEVVRSATAKLRDAEAKLADLEDLLAIAKIAAGKASVETARTVVRQADAELAKVLAQISAADPLQETWVTEVVASAFSRLKLAKKTLVDLEGAVVADAVSTDEA